jgi:hypothetical protein
MKQSDGCMLEAKRHVEQIGKTRDKTRDKTYNETSNEHAREKMKDVPKPTGGIRGKWQIVTLFSIFPFIILNEGIFTSKFVSDHLMITPNCKKIISSNRIKFTNK